MPFPESERVIYRKNPLAEVICQLRFPAILRIETELPSAFQERIRRQYPIFRSKPSIALPANIPLSASQLASADFPFPIGNKTYEFASADDIWTVSLTQESLALTTRQYVRWEDFKKHFAESLEALLTIYEPAYFLRIGLRYVDVIRRSLLGLEGEAWSRLLQPYIASELASTDVSADIIENFSQVAVRLDTPDGLVRIRHGLAYTQEIDEDCYVIDSDFFTEERKETHDAIEVLDQFKRQAGHLFRWCITDQLHKAMEPQPVE